MTTLLRRNLHPHRLGWLLAFWTVSAISQPLPRDAGPQHLGAASCAGSTCHSAGSPTGGARVQLNEFNIWQRQDAHSNAYKALQSDAGRRIASHLGLKSAMDDMCLACHTDHVKPAQQGKRYRQSEGVSCEACHGGGEKWLGPHATGIAKPAELIQAGMYPLADAVSRGKLCLSCHQSSAERPANHRLFGAGHPPLNRFELDTYTATQPAHYRVDDDYRQRKPVHGSARTWVTGQMLAATTLLAEIQGPALTQNGSFPELAFYDCDACHHPMNNVRWNPSVGGDLPPGHPRVADAALTMTGYAISAMSPLSYAAWQAELTVYRKAGTESVTSLKASAKRLQDQLSALQKTMLAREPSATEIRGMLTAIIKDVQARSAGSYLHAAQSTMAISALLADSKKTPASRKAIDALFNATDNMAHYEPAKFIEALAGIQPLIVTVE